MTELRALPRRIRQLGTGHELGWNSLAERCAALFLAGGVLLFVTTALFVVQLVTPLSTQGPLTGVTSFTGLVLSYVGLLGLYPRFAERTPNAARAGFVLILLPLLVLIVILVWGIASHLPIGAAPSPVDVVPDLGKVFVMIFLLFTVGVGVFGVVSLRTGIPSRIIGVLLLGFAATWVLLLGASAVYGTQFPTWLDTVSVAVRAILLTGIGYSLKSAGAIDNHTERIQTQ